MTSGRPSRRGDYNITTDPDRFDVTKGRLNIKNIDSQIAVFNNLTDTGDIYSDVYTVNNVEGFSVIKYGAADIVIEACNDAQTLIWATIETMTSNPDVYSSSDKYVLIRFKVTDPTNLSLILRKKYATY